MEKSSYTRLYTFSKTPLTLLISDLMNFIYCYLINNYITYKMNLLYVKSSTFTYLITTTLK